MGRLGETNQVLQLFLLLHSSFTMAKPQNKSKTKRRSKTAWTEADIENALQEISAGSLVRPTAKKHGMSEGVLRKRIKIIT